LKEAAFTGWLVVIATLVLTLGSWVLGYAVMGSTP
jgi:hypothetical protein